MIAFSIHPHTRRPGATVVEVRDDKGNLLMTVCPDTSETGIRVISKYQMGFEDKSQGAFCIYEIAFSGTSGLARN